MKYTVRTLPAALGDVSDILTWLSSRSAEAAQLWYAAFLQAIRKLESNAEIWGPAPEAAKLRHPIRQKLFKTRLGRPYRLLFAIVDDEVLILRVRGPGQAPLSKMDITPPSE